MSLLIITFNMKYLMSTICNGVYKVTTSAENKISRCLIERKMTYAKVWNVLLSEC